MADKISISARVEVNGRVRSLGFGQPLHLSGDSRKHRAQLDALFDEIKASTLNILGGQFEDTTD